MIEHQRNLWATECFDECVDELTDIPRCWNASLNLGNEKHNDHDGDRSFAVWVATKWNH